MQISTVHFFVAKCYGARWRIFLIGIRVSFDTGLCWSSGRKSFIIIECHCWKTYKNNAVVEHPLYSNSHIRYWNFQFFLSKPFLLWSVWLTLNLSLSEILLAIGVPWTNSWGPVSYLNFHLLLLHFSVVVLVLINIPWQQILFSFFFLSFVFLLVIFPSCVSH